MKEITIKLYEYAELSKKAQEKAHAEYLEHSYDDTYLQVTLDNDLSDLLEQYEIVPVSTADKKYPSKYAQLYYSLSNSQGDGVMFEGTFIWKEWTVNIKQNGHYYHSNSKDIDMVVTDTLEHENGPLIAPQKAYDDFEVIYQKICEELETLGYSTIEDLRSEAYFVEECNANDWTFEKDGTMRNVI